MDIPTVNLNIIALLYGEPISLVIHAVGYSAVRKHRGKAHPVATEYE